MESASTICAGSSIQVFNLTFPRFVPSMYLQLPLFICRCKTALFKSTAPNSSGMVTCSHAQCQHVFRPQNKVANGNPCNIWLLMWNDGTPLWNNGTESMGNCRLHGANKHNRCYTYFAHFIFERKPDSLLLPFLT